MEYIEEYNFSFGSKYDQVGNTNSQGWGGGRRNRDYKKGKTKPQLYAVGLNTLIYTVINATLHHYHTKSSTNDNKKMRTDEI